MEQTTYIKALENPQLIKADDTAELRELIVKYPYFQSARALYLKALKNQESFKYNHELKKTAAHTSNRTVLFDFITSENFTQAIPTQEDKASEKFSLKDLIPKKKDKVAKAQEDLAIGKPLAFTKNETFSFNQWLQLADKKEIDRSVTPVAQEEKTVEEEAPKTEQELIIERFIQSNPKITRPNKSNPKEFKAKESQQESTLMTETLAKVYLEQKKYDSAIKAYTILSLKYPEKSGFFADQIKRIQILQKN